MNLFQPRNTGQWLALDKRSLGLFRICLGLTLLGDILLRVTHFCAHYSQTGFLPLKHYLYQPDLTFRRWSLLYLNDSPLFVGLFFLFFFVAAFCLTVGYRTRLAGWICWACILSVFRRNPVINNSGDVYLPLLIMWANFLPWGERFSVSQTPEERPGGNLFTNFPAFCYLCQVGMLYWFSAVLRIGKEWQVDGNALYYALSLQNYQTLLAPYMLVLGSGLLAFVTFATLYLEILGPILLLVPSQWARLISVLLIMSFHIGIVMNLDIYVFAIVCSVGPIGLLPPLIWENRLGSRAERTITGFFSGKMWSKLRSARPTTRDGGVWFKRVYQFLPYPIMGFTIFSLWWTIHWPEDRHLLTGTMKAFSLDQRWGMFSPKPPDSVGLCSMQAVTRSGKEVNLATQDAYTQPTENFQPYPYPWNYRWRAFERGVIIRRGESHAQLYLRYLASRWNQAHPEDPVVRARWVYHVKTIPTDYLLEEKGEDVISVYHQ